MSSRYSRVAPLDIRDLCLRIFAEDREGLRQIKSSEDERGDNSQMSDISAQRPRVTIVEDDLSLLSALAFALEEDGFAVASFDRGRALLDRPNATDCLVVDLKLKDVDGLTLISALRELGLSPPAILITTNPDDRCRRRAAEAGVQIVEKPLIGADLGRRIAEAINGAS
jgi:FixJ family two-component response regulator